MFNFNEMSIPEKAIVIGAGAMTVGNTVMNVFNNRKIKKVDTSISSEINAIKIDQTINKVKIDMLIML